MAAPVDVTASVPAFDKDFSRPPKNHDPDAPSCSTELAAH
jgi:hypothetical protein